MSAALHIPTFRAPKPPEEITSASHQWELITGTVQLFISGPGPQAWFACSKPNYEPGSKPGTPRECAIAKRALHICIQRHREDRDAGVSHIQEALALATQQHDRQAARVETLTN